LPSTVLDGIQMGVLGHPGGIVVDGCAAQGVALAQCGRTGGLRTLF